MPITVPQPMTQGVPPPVTVTHTPYNPAQAAWNAQSPQTFSQPLPQIGSVLSQFMPAQPQSAKPVPAASQIYKPADPGHLQQYLQKLNLGWSVDPNTGQMISPGMRGGTSLASYTAHKGILDPASAQAAINQFKAGGGVAQYGQGGYVAPGQSSVPAGFWGGSGLPIPGRPVSPAFQAPQTTNYYNPQFSQPAQMTFKRL